MSSSVDQIKSKLDIVTVVSGYIKLEKSGGNFKARCPFHNEKTPSFFVSPDRGNYYCFGCGAKGDIFTFIQEFEGLDFPGALKVLADRAGVKLENFKSEDSGGKEKIFSLMEQATFYFEKNLLENKEALDYLKSRGVNDETIKNFRLGFALDEWRGLHDFLISKGSNVFDLEKAGLVKRKEGGGFYDTFRSRIIFPIADSSGRIVAFSGRIFGAEEDNPSTRAKHGTGQDAPKYLNSPETEIFHKSEILYGLDKAKKAIRQMDYSILVEGQMDLVMLHQVGLYHTVASSGTALTENHLVRLQRLSNRLIMAFDGDQAGFKAITRGAEIALALGMEVKVAVMPDGSDPADMALKDKEKLLSIIKDSKHIISFVLDLTISSSKDHRVIARKIVSDVLPFISKVKQSYEQSHFMQEISLKTGLKEEPLWDDLRKIRTNADSTRTDAENKNITQERSEIILKKLIGILIWQKSKKDPLINILDLENKISNIIGSELFNLCLSDFKTNAESLLFETEAYYNGNDYLSNDISLLLANLEEEKLKNEFTKTMILLHKAEVSKDAKESERLFAVCQEISKKVNELKRRHDV